MKALIRGICALSVLCGLAQSLVQEGSGKRTMSLVCAVVLAAGFLRFFHAPDWESYALELRQLQLREDEFLQQNEEKLRSLDRRVIEDEYNAYILDMATKRGLILHEVRVQAQWSMEGLWLPYALTISGEATEGEKTMLEAMIEADLGIPRQRQIWRQDSG